MITYIASFSPNDFSTMLSGGGPEFSSSDSSSNSPSHCSMSSSWYDMLELPDEFDVSASGVKCSEGDGLDCGWSAQWFDYSQWLVVVIEFLFPVPLLKKIRDHGSYQEENPHVYPWEASWMLVWLVVLTFNMSVERLKGVCSTHNLRDRNAELMPR